MWGCGAHQADTIPLILQFLHSTLPQHGRLSPINRLANVCSRQAELDLGTARHPKNTSTLPESPRQPIIPSNNIRYYMHISYKKLNVLGICGLRVV